MPAQAPKSFWQRARIHFRRFRLTLWLALLAVLLALLYFSVVGLPGFIKRPLLENLRARGVQVEFKNLRLSWYRGLVAYDVRFGGTQDPAAPRLSADRVELAINAAQLCRLKFQIGGLVIHDARVAWPLAGTNEFALEKIHAELRFLPGDQWQLDNLQLKLASAQIRAGGTLTNASAIARWKIFQRGETNGAQKFPARIQQIADSLAQLHFNRPPTLRVNFSGDALRPQSMSVTLRARLDNGGMTIRTAINPDTRELRFSGSSDFDAQKLLPVLPEKAAHWLGQFSWEQPPQVRVAGSVVLPASANRAPDWQDALANSARLDGEFKVANAAFRGIAALAAQSHFSLSNRVWRLPDLRLTRPEGGLSAEHWTDERTQDFYWHLRGVFDPQSVRPLLEAPAQHALDLVHFSAAPVLDAELWGRWRDRDRIGVKADVTVASNFTFRGETAATLHTRVEYTNLYLKLIEPRLTRDGGQHAALSSVEVDFDRKLLFLTNGQCVIDPQVVCRAIGTKTAHIMEAYQFSTPPATRVEGMVSVENSRVADLHFDVDGGPFHWWKLNATRINGSVLWQNETLSITNVQADFHGGKLAGWVGLNFHPNVGNDFSFDLTMDEARLGPLIADLSQNTNQLEGVVSGRLNVTSANSSVPDSWQGGGNMRLHDGLLWEIPVFGVFAPVLNVVYPNLGSGRASRGSATFTITNSVIRSDDLELRSPAMRLQYRGTVDFAGNLNARVEAELLRDTWGIGPIVSTALWPLTKILEYKVTGDLAKPKIAPLYLPKALLFPFHPIQSVKELLPDKSDATNAPARFMELPPGN